MFKNLSGTVRTLLFIGIAAIVVLAADTDLDLWRCGWMWRRARETALAAAAGGEVISQEIDQEGLWNEYSFDIMNGDMWYEVEINAFGSVTGLESSQSGYGDYTHRD